MIVEHFREHVRHRIGGKAKAMVVTSGRLPAVRYMQAFERYIKERGYSDVRALVAFSGTVVDPASGKEFTEPRMNIDIKLGEPISEAALPGRFDSPDYQILLVAEKYQTGFDQPLLHAMYVDLNDPEFREVVSAGLLKAIFDTVTAEAHAEQR